MEIHWSYKAMKMKISHLQRRYYVTNSGDKVFDCIPLWIYKTELELPAIASYLDYISMKKTKEKKLLPKLERLAFTLVQNFDGNEEK